MSEQNQKQGESTASKSEQKQAYAQPKLVKHGNVESMTMQAMPGTSLPLQR